MATTWEYKRGIELDNEQMNTLGTDGWELVNIFPVPSTKLRGSDVRGGSIPPLTAPGTPIDPAVVSFWKRPK